MTLPHIMHDHITALLDAGHEIRLERYENEGEKPRYWAHVTDLGGANPRTAEGKTPADAIWTASPLHDDDEPVPKIFDLVAETSDGLREVLEAACETVDLKRDVNGLVAEMSDVLDRLDGIEDKYTRDMSIMIRVVAELHQRAYPDGLVATRRAERGPGEGAPEPCADVVCGHAKDSHWEHGEPDGRRQGCAILGCKRMAYMARVGQ